MTREFRPPIRKSRFALIFGVVLAVITLLGGAVLGAVALGSSQVSYTIRSGTLTVDSGSFIDGKRTFAVADVTDARALTVSDGTRMRGTGAPGVCTGLWWYPSVGEVWQATNCSSRAVLLQVTGQERPILVSPPDPDAFVTELKPGTNDSIVLPPGDATVMRVVPGVGALVLVLSAVLLTMLFVVGPKRMRYVVADGELSVHTIFSRRSFDARELRARLHVPAVTLRLAGTAFPGYYTGLFRADGVTTRVYATQLKSEGVLLEGPARVFLSPEDPAALLKALGEAGATCS